eukprot:CAMPEP_0116871438 /NCGR_PEP_ID=MMETSP0463-20121206/1803_1 /TAXON_ID=181622 /ORGANISM="Strombidinopsis sp, Strain SopsisLIS2011" /LENGTH=103 /DNA_ID=CAMNT_0004509889 /DNA_START=25 /DNA_END=336 /DNA_ORIENTATION=-
MADNSSRMIRASEFPSTLYAQTLVYFFGANLMYHKHIFRTTGNRVAFSLFMVANAFTSYQLAECTNLTIIDRDAAAYNNTLEVEHRAQINQKLRLNMMKTPMF